MARAGSEARFTEESFYYEHKKHDEVGVHELSADTIGDRNERLHPAMPRKSLSQASRL